MYRAFRCAAASGQILMCSCLWADKICMLDSELSSARQRTFGPCTYRAALRSAIRHTAIDHAFTVDLHVLLTALMACSQE